MQKQKFIFNRKEMPFPGVSGEVGENLADCSAETKEELASGFVWEARVPGNGRE